MIIHGHELKFSEAAHRYSWNKKHVPSVTTILNRMAKPALIPWAAKCSVEYAASNIHTCMDGDGGLDMEEYRRMLDSAKNEHTRRKVGGGDVGTIIHDYANHLMRTGSLVIKGAGDEPVDPQVQRSLAALLDWYKAHEIKPLGVERKVFSQAFWYAGRTDFYGYINGRLGVLDFKTGGIWPEMWLQAAAYDRALAEEGATAEMDHWLIHLDKNTGQFRPLVRRAGPETKLAVESWLDLVRFDASYRKLEKINQQERKAAAQAA